MVNTCFSRDIIQQADDFFEAYRRCTHGENPRKDEYGRLCLSVVNIPAIVNAAFSCELYFKSIIGSKAKGHALRELFDQLDVDAQNYLREPINKEFAKNNLFDFDVCLDHISNAFVEWRYIYEESHTEGFYGCYINEFLMFFNLLLPLLKDLAHKA